MSPQPATGQASTAPPIEGDPGAAATLDPSRDTQESAAGVDRSAESAGVLPVVRLTPRDIEVPGLENFRQDLGGTWDFVFKVPEGFDGTGGSVEQWDQVQMPGHPTLQGFPPMHKEDGVPVAYRRSFDVPLEWDGHRVVLRFEGVDGYTKVWVNGHAAGSNEVATLPGEFDITEHVRFGDSNELTLTIEKSLVTHWSKRKLGGITREVYVQALPPLNLARLHVDTDLHPETDSATLNAHLRIANQSGEAVSGLTAHFVLTGPDGRARSIDPSPEGVPLPPVAAGQMLSVSMPLPVASPELWTAETPTLYELRGELRRDGEPVMAAKQRFGFREVEVVGHELRVNGRPIKMRGTNYHITYPGLAETMTRDLIRRDLELFMGCNFNALRSRPTPDIAYVELCDELGIYTTVEAMITLMMYDKGPKGDHGADPAIAPGFRHHVATMIESYYSNPSVITWGLGNECPYYDWFQTAALGMHAADPSRPLFFGSDARLGVGIPFMDINDDHYPRAKHGTTEQFYGIGDDEDPAVLKGTGWDYPKDRPNIFTEWMHVHTNNVKELRYDPGIDDYWVHVADTHVEQLYAEPHFAGGFHFKGAPYRGIGVNFPWRGVFTEDRRPLDLYWHVKKTHSPVRIFHPQAARDEATGHAVVEVTNRFDFLDLADIEFNWETDQGSGQAHTTGAPGNTAELRIPLTDDDPGPVRLSVVDNKGDEIDRYVLHLPQRRSGRTEKPADGEPAETNRPTVENEDNTFAVRAGKAIVRFDRGSGLPVSVSSSGGDPVISGPPSLLVLPTQLRNFKRQQELTLVNQAYGWSAQHVEVDEQPEKVIVTTTGAFANAEGKFVTTVAADGRIDIAYAFVWTGEQGFNVFSAGLTLPVSATHDTLRWERDARWSAYPPLHIGRAKGEAPAAGDPVWDSARANAEDGLPDDFPWSQALVAGVSRDFRSTKFNVRTGGLFDASGNGIKVDGGGEIHLQAVPLNGDLDGELTTAEHHGPPGDGYALHVLNFHNGGTEPHLTKSLRFGEMFAEPGAQFSGRVRFRFVDRATEAHE